MCVVEGQQCQVDALSKVSSLGDVWRGLSHDFHSTDSPVQHSKDTVDRCCAVMAWISLNCLKCVHKPEGDKGGLPQFRALAKSEFQLGAFAREVADRLSGAERAVLQTEKENLQLKETVELLERRCRTEGREIKESHRQLEELRMQCEDQRGNARFVSAAVHCIYNVPGHRHRHRRLKLTVHCLSFG
jgi:hypothetical protein